MPEEEDKKISALPEKTTLDDTDYIAVVNTTADPISTEKITIQNAKSALKGDPGEDGANGADGVDGTQFPWRGPWVTTTSYVENDCVNYNGSGYVCVVDHTSGAFVTDLGSGYWSLLVQKGDKGETGDTGPTGATGADVTLMYGTSTTPPSEADDGTLYVTYLP